MKKNIFMSVLTAIAVLGVCSCNKTTSPSAADEIKSPAPGQAELNLRVVTNATKTTVRSDAQDCAINSLAVLVFSDDDALENIVFGTVDSTGKFNSSINTSMGVKTVCVIANGSQDFYDRLKGINDLEDYSAMYSFLHEDNATDSFFMVGKKEDEDIDKESYDLSIQISRIVAKIEIQKITYAVTEETDFQLSKENFKLNAIYLVNIPVKYLFNGGAPTEWFNCLNCDETITNLYGDFDIDFDLKKEKTYDTAHYLYCYPNPYTNTGCEDFCWCPRPTRLVIECSRGDDGDVVYYSFEMPNAKQNANVTQLSSNKTYTITSCTITRSGSSEPWESAPIGSIALSITVKDWETGASYEYTI